MKKIILFSVILMPPPIFASEKEVKEYYEQVMGSLVLVKETASENGSRIEGEFRKGDKVTCVKDSSGNIEAKFLLKKGGEIEPEAMLDTPQNLYDSLKKKAEQKVAN